MAAITTVAAKVRPLTGAVIRRFPAGATTIVPGKPVYVDSTGKILLAENGDVVGKVQARGIVVAVGVNGAVAAAIGDMCDVVVFGPVEVGASGLTDGSVIYVGVVAGTLDQTATVVVGDFNFVVGFAESDNVIFVNPQVHIPTAV